MFPDKFRESLTGLPGIGGPGELLAALDTPPMTSVRFNPYKLTQKPEGDSVPWSRYGFYLDERPAFTLDPAFHGGAYYVQEPGSMFIEHIYRTVAGDRTDMRILDLCASPGGKTTLLSTLAGLEGLVVSNEVIRSRIAPLTDNVKKWGLGNVLVTNNDPADFSNAREFFDLILVDAPCSGEGMFRKDRDARGQWSPGNVAHCAERQRRILADVWRSLKPGGHLIYSTCTFNTEENENNLEWLSKEFGAEGVEIPTDPGWGIVTGFVEIPGTDMQLTDCGDNNSLPIRTFRFYPHLTRSEGFFAAVVRKPASKIRTRFTTYRQSPIKPLKISALRKEASGWVGQPGFMEFYTIGDSLYGCYKSAFNDIFNLSECLNTVYSGVQMGQFFGNILKPSHPLALFHDVKRGSIPIAELDVPEAVEYLRKNDIPLDGFAEGMNLVTSGNLPLGWAKKIGNRINNLYPKELRILNQRQ